MRFQKKVFLSSFFTSALLLITLSASVEELLRRGLESQFLDHYDSLSQVIGDTLRQMEGATARISSGSARTLYNLTQKANLPSEQALKGMKSDLAISQLVITDQKGKILRDTETPPELRKATLFDFCEGYRNLLRDPGRIETTPILPSYPSGQAYIFSMMANEARTGVVEAGVHVSFIVETLGKAMRSDPNIRSIGLYTPKGVPLGFISQDSGASSALLPLNDLSLGNHELAGDHLAIVSQVPALVETCCECVQKQLIQPGGRYYYLLRTEISTGTLRASLSSLRLRALFILSAAIALALLLARWISGLLTKRLQLFGDAVRKVVESGDLNHSLYLDQEKDEISELAASFEELTSKLDRTQKLAILDEKNRALAAVAKQVAHDIRSPLAALQAATHENEAGNQKLIRSASRRIHEIAENLLSRYREDRPGHPTLEVAGPLGLAACLNEALDEKIAELGTDGKYAFSLSFGEGALELYAKIRAMDLRRVISNLLNNAAEASGSGGSVQLLIERTGPWALLSVEDQGRGIPPELIPLLMSPGRSFGKEGGNGLGLAHAREVVKAAGGDLTIQSQVGQGTRVQVKLPLVEAPAWHVSELFLGEGTTVMILDDDQSIHRLWRSRLQEAGVNVLHYFGTEEWAHQHQIFLAEGRDILCLVDQEIEGSPETGMAAILRTNARGHSILVTSYADDPAMAARCLAEGIRLLPKTLVARLPIRVGKTT